MQSNNHLPAKRCSHEQPVAATQTGSTCCNFIPLFNQICPSPLNPGASLVSSSSISSNVVGSSAKDELCEGRVPVLHTLGGRFSHNPIVADLYFGKG
ncbi:hypothetical protein TNCV_972091 [Trichonephila clavipes]|nr:hypothetical protein TNCV_972091 [Trichonephila clavipes]